MKTLKRMLAIALCAVLCIALSACSLRNQPAEEPTTVINTATVTIPEGFTVTQIAKRLEDAEVCSAADFIEACKTVPEGYSTGSEESISKRLFPMEGFIFPDTYEFYKNETAENVMKKFLDNTNSKVDEADFKRAEELGLTMDQVFTLASIIQAEASHSSEMPKVSGVFWNRLKNKADFPYIGSDVTRQYIDTKMKSYIEENCLDYDALFAAYCTNDKYDLKTAGLPAGPICNPGREAIQAALYPDNDKYYYFFTDDQMNYYSFETLSQFQTGWYNLKHFGSVSGAKE